MPPRKLSVPASCLLFRTFSLLAGRRKNSPAVYASCRFFRTFLSSPAATGTRRTRFLPVLPHLFSPCSPATAKTRRTRFLPVLPHLFSPRRPPQKLAGPLRNKKQREFLALFLFGNQFVQLLFLK
ncbi:MAG: hypothetical protein NC209_03535 [Alistipes sp.]|nr:hypothetical protein [Alistipes senegalensis]MCM1250202.1 hypothetical protein [Alistipes sp.]